MDRGWSNREYVANGSPASPGSEPATKRGAGTHGPGTLLPWPALSWQQAALAGTVVLGLIVSAVGIVAMGEAEGLVGGMVATLVGFGIAGMALYAGWSTRWLNRTSMAPLPAKVAGGIAIIPVIVVAIFLYYLLLAFSLFSFFDF